MAYGPEKTLPVGTKKYEFLYRTVEKIDSRIKDTEGQTVKIDTYDLWKFYSGGIEEDLINVYLKAGWKFAYFYKFQDENFFLLSNDPQHKKRPIKELKKSLFQRIYEFFFSYREYYKPSL